MINVSECLLNLYGCVYDFSLDCNTVYVSETVDIHKYLMKKHIMK